MKMEKLPKEFYTIAMARFFFKEIMLKLQDYINYQMESFMKMVKRNMKANFLKGNYMDKEYHMIIKKLSYSKESS
jgi:hypothetical protein